MEIVIILALVALAITVLYMTIKAKDLEDDSGCCNNHHCDENFPVVMDELKNIYHPEKIKNDVCIPKTLDDVIKAETPKAPAKPKKPRPKKAKPSPDVVAVYAEPKAPKDESLDKRLDGFATPKKKPRKPKQK